MTDALHGDVLQHLHLLVGKRTGWSHNDRLTCMDSEWVKVFHSGNGEATVVSITDALELNLLPSLQTLLNKYLRCKSEGRFSNLLKLLFGLADTRTETTQRVGRTDHDRVADVACRSHSLLHVFASVAYRHLEVNLVKLLYEEVAVFCVHDSLYRSTQHIHTILLKHTVEVKFCTNVQTRLSTPSQHDAVWALLLDNFSYKKRCHRQEINLVSNTFTCLNCSNVWINEDGTNTLLAQSLESLRTGIVKLTCLADFQSTGTQNEDFLKLFLHH